MKYVELHARSAFSFLRGASEPQDLAGAAAFMGMGKIALCDRDGVYGSARLHAAAKNAGLSALVGAELTLEDGAVLPVLVQNRTGYQNLCRLITGAKLRGTKTHAPVHWSELPQYSEGLVALTGDEEGILRDPQNAASLDRLVAAFGGDNVFVEIQRHRLRGEAWRNQTLIDLARSRGIPPIATNGVLYAHPAGREVLDVFTCIRHHTHLDAAGRLLAANGERHLKSSEEMAELFADLPEAIENTVRVAERLEFTLENLGYEFPKYDGLEGEAADAFLRERVLEGARERYGTPSSRVLDQINTELALIKKLKFAGYFLIVWDIVRFCRDNDVLVQGRGSAANSVVCFCLKITACDPIAYKLMFERFLSEECTAWPDIDLDLPSGERREKVIQEVYHRYGKHGAAMTANVITYRGRSAMREIGKALNFAPDIVDRFSRLFANGDLHHTIDLPARLRLAGLSASHPRLAAARELYGQILDLPRHLGQHSGGMIICRDALSSVVPLENASMPGRVVAQWDKDDCEDLGIVKVDLLGLGMMAAMQDAFVLCKERHGRPEDFSKIPPEDPAVFEMLQRADTIGTFQVESRAQMATLPKFLPRNFYDIVMQVAIIRPGPIQGGMLSALVARRNGLEDDEPFAEELREVLERTHGVPLFQEQLLQMAKTIAGFSGGEADELRRALSFNRSQKRMDKVCTRLREAMDGKGVNPDVAEKVVKSIQSFAVFGFPESHAISFALIAYASCWLKVHRAPEFYCVLLNNQPMGFYSSATLIQDAKAHGVKVRPVSVLHSDWECTIELDDAIRLGLLMVRGMDSGTAQRIVAERKVRSFASLEDFRRRVEPDRPALRVLSRIGALNGLVAHRRDGLWKTESPLRADDLPGFHLENETPAPLAAMDAFERLEADFSGTGVTTGRHPMALIRAELPEVARAGDLPAVSSGQVVRIAGLVICRQRPGTAKGVVFVSLEDETGVANAILYADFFEKNRLVVTQEKFLLIEGILQNERGSIHIQARRVEALRYGECATPVSHDFH
jgi:error-prone DNA polymerase